MIVFDNMNGTVTVKCEHCGYTQVYLTYQSYPSFCYGCGHHD